MFETRSSSRRIDSCIPAACQTTPLVTYGTLRIYAEFRRVYGQDGQDKEADRMRAPAIAFIVAVLWSRVRSKAAPPAAPQLTVGADIKQLIFDWDDVAGAAYYRLLVQVNADPYKP
jgi:hypothetical protein